MTAVIILYYDDYDYRSRASDGLFDVERDVKRRSYYLL